jgi:Flp pilus assembly protein TadD
MINLWAMKRINRKRFIRVSLICLVVLFFLPFLNISYIYAGRPGGVSSDAEAYRTKGYDAQQRGDIDTAIEWYQKAANLMPNYASPHNDLGILFESKGWLDRAASEYEKALAIDPNYKEVHTNMALLYERKGELDKAAFHWMRRYKLGSPEDPWTQEAKNRLEKLGLLEKAESVEQIKKGPPVRKRLGKKQKPEAKKDTGWTRLGSEKNKKQAAVKESSKVLDEELQESLRLAEERLKKEKAGKEDTAYVKKQIDTGEPVLGEAGSSYNKAKDYYNKGEYAKALDTIRLAKQNSPQNSLLLNLEDEIKFKMKEERIEDHYKEGIIHYRQKDFAGARKEFEAILSILPE